MSKILQELASRATRQANQEEERNEKVYSLKASLYDKQLEFYSLDRPKKLAVCSRRAGKTNLAARWMCIKAEEMDGVVIPYITLSLKNAKRLMWPMLNQLNREYGLNINFRRTELIAEFPNGSEIWLCGLADLEDMDKLRGPKYPLVILDECQSMRSYLKQCIEDVIEPATLDYGLSASIVMFGTPNASLSGFFYESDRFSKAWGKKHWTMLDNPFLPHAKDWLAKKKIENGWDNSTAIYRREYKGEWVRDNETLVYHFDKEHHVVPESRMPNPQECTLILGVDLGYEDDTSFTIEGFLPYERNAFIFESFKKKHLITDDIANIIMQLTSKYQILTKRESPFVRKVVDSGGLGKMIVEEMNRRFGLSLYPAAKTSKLEFIQLLNADFKLNRILIHEDCIDLIDELQLLEWNPSHLEKGRYIENDSCSNHCTDSFLYAWRECYHYLSKETENVSKYSVEWWKKQEDDMEKECLEALEEKNTFWWEDEFNGNDDKTIN